MHPNTFIKSTYAVSRVKLNLLGRVEVWGAVLFDHRIRYFTKFGDIILELQYVLMLLGQRTMMLSSRLAGRWFRRKGGRLRYARLRENVCVTGLGWYRL